MFGYVYVLESRVVGVKISRIFYGDFIRKRMDKLNIYICIYIYIYIYIYIFVVTPCILLSYSIIIPTTAHI